MSGYRATDLSTRQRDLMAAVLSSGPDQRSGVVVIKIVTRVLRGQPGVDQSSVQQFQGRLDEAVSKAGFAQHGHPRAGDDPGVAPLDPFLNIAERLQMPVAVREHHVEVPLHALAEHLDSANSVLRTNLHNAVVQLHNAGYVLRNHPHLTHSEAHVIADEDAV